MSDPRTCPECGSDTYAAQNFPRLVQKVAALEQQLRTQAANHGLISAQWAIERIDKANERSWLAQKADRQRRVINRLEAKLRKLGQAPHAPDLDEPPF